ncbi:MAG: MTH895/ArsE family thioredoxin-like protein [Armatimonadota bacterium]
MHIQVFGKGCPKCNQLTENVRAALQELDRTDATVEHVTDLDRIVALGPVVTPVLVVDGKIVSMGKTLSPRAVAELLRAVLS